MRRFLIAFALLIPLAIYFSLALPNLDLPGLHNDEAMEAGLQAEQILSGRPITAFRGAGPALGGRTFPLMVQDYIGALNVYLALPFWALLGGSVFALRFYTVLVGALTIVCTHGFTAAALGRRAALVAALLLAASPSFVFWQRQGVFVMSLTAALAMAAMWAGAAWAKHGGRRPAALTGLLCGAGIYAKLLFVWIIGGALGALAVINLPQLLRVVWRWRSQKREEQKDSMGVRDFAAIAREINFFPRRPSLADAAAFAIGLLIGLAPLIVYNAQTGGTLASVATNLTTSYYGVANLHFTENLRGRIDQFRAVIDGRDHLWYLGGSFGNPGWEIALLLAAVLIAGRALFRRQRAQLPLFLLLTLALGVAQSSFTVSGIFPTHFAVFAPLWPVIVAAASETIFNPFYEPKFTRFTTPIGRLLRGGRCLGGLGFITDAMIVLAIALGWLLARDIAVVNNYQRALVKTGGLGPHSDAVYRLADYLQEHEAPTVIAMDWGFAPQVRLLTAERVAPQELFGYTWEADDNFAERLAAALDQPQALFVFHFPQETIFPRREAFEAMIAERGWKTEQLAIISRRDGAPIFEIVRAIR